MHFTFSTSTITSFSGAALLSTSTSHQVAASVSLSSQPLQASSSFKALSKAQGDECSFINAFKVQEILAATGILKCGAYEICVEDASSSVGGRCIALAQKETYVKAHRELVACTFTDGTAGVKCDGKYACNGANESLIGCGSCIGDEACFELKAGTTVGENSCIGGSACYKFEGSVGNNSCRDILACHSAVGKHAFVFLSSMRGSLA